jgi:hypothetical protein
MIMVVVVIGKALLECHYPYSNVKKS